MSEKIYRALSKDFINRMRWWAIGGELSTIASSWPIDGPGLGLAQKHRFHVTRIPPMKGINHDTEMALGAIPARYAQAVRQFWLFEGRSLRWHGRHRKVEYHTFESWVIKGHDLLRVEFERDYQVWLVQHSSSAPIEHRA